MNKIIELQLELIRNVHRPFNGTEVAKDLLSFQDLWCGVMTYDTNFHGLIDMQAGEWSADTLFIMPVPGDESQLMAMAANWNPDGLQWADSNSSDLLDGWNLDEMGLRRGILMLFWRGG